VNVDLVALPGVDVVANAEALPFRTATFQRVECDAVIEHVERPGLVMSQIVRVLAPGGFAHVVVPFCHPFSRIPARLQALHTRWIRTARGPAPSRCRGLAQRPNSNASRFYPRICEALAAVAPRARSRMVF
jgi:ubiquinone/menaquinone biosynthesis C-methylase UbiE